MTILKSELFSTYASGFAEELAGLGYKSSTAGRHVRLFARLADWLSVEGVLADDLTTGLIDRFVAADRRPGQRWPSTRSLVPLLAYLRGEGVVISAETVSGWTAEVLTGFRRYLVCERGLCSSTVQNYVWFAGLFLAAMPDSVQVDLGLVTAADVTSAVCSCCDSRSVGWVRNFATVARSLLRFGLLDGRIRCDLTACVLPVASWRHRSLPTSLAWSDVERLLVACEQSRRGSRRDRAILLLLARLGLRAGEVAALTLDDLDWRVGEIVVTGKNGRRDRLPVPVDVGEAIVDYICDERSATTSRALLILSVAPRQPMTARTVAWVVRCACGCLCRDERSCPGGDGRQQRCRAPGQPTRRSSGRTSRSRRFGRSRRL